MSKISIYDVVPVPKLADKLIGTSVGGEPEDLTYNFTLGELLNLFIPNIPGNTLQGVLDFGNTATQDINLTGTINTTTLNVGNTANILDSNLTGETHITGGLYDSLNSIGTAGQVLKSTGTQVEWFTIPTVIPNLQQVLASGNTAVNNIILTGDLSANNAALLTSTISTSLTLLGTLRDGLSSVGTNNQVLSSNVTGVRWVNLPVYSAASPLLYNSGTGVFSIQQANASQGGFLSAADWITFDGKQTAISLTTTNNSGPSTLIGSTINVPNYTLAGLNGVPQTRTLTINGVTYNLSADRSWTIAAGVSSVSATTPLFSSGGANPNITIQQSSSSLDGYLSSVDWLTFNNKQDFLGGTGLVKSVGGVISYITDNSANWNTAYNDSIVSAAVTGTATKTLTLNQQDGGTITASWSDIDTGLTSVGVSMPTAFTVTNSPLTSNGTIAITGSGNTLQYIDGTGALQTFPSLTGFVPYTGATGSVNLGVYSLTATSLIKNGGTSAQFLKADGSVDSNAYIVLGSLSASTPLSYNNTTGAFSISQSGSSTNGYLSSTDWSIFNSKQDALTLTTTGTSGPSTLIGSTLNIPQYTDQFVGTVTSVAALTLGTIGTDLSSTVANSTTTPVITLNVPTASAVNRGALSSADWTTFNNKQPAGNYITSLTGEATALGPGAAAVTLDNAAVISKVLTGLNVTGGTVVAADSILTGFGKVQNQINGIIGGTIFQGTWNANTNTPALVSSVGTNGHYYIVSVAGTTNLDGITDWQVGDWAIFAGTTWEKVDNTDSVSSVNGFTGAVSLTTDNIPEGATNLYFTNTRARTAISLTTTGSSGASTYDNTTGVFNIPNYTDQFVGTVTSVGLSSVTSGVTIGSTPITTSGTITIAIATATASQNGLLSSTDWTTFNSKQGAITLTTTGTSGASTLVGNTLNIPTYTDQFVGTVTSVSFTLGSTGTDLSSSVANSTTTPAITLNVPTASASARGALSSTDWSTFNSKQDAITLTTTGTSGAATLVGATLNIPQYQAAGTYVTSVTATTPLFSSGGSTPNLTIQQSSGSQAGYLSSTDWTTFNNKQNALTNPVTGTGLTNRVAKFSSNGSTITYGLISDDGASIETNAYTYITKTLIPRQAVSYATSFKSLINATAGWIYLGDLTIPQQGHNACITMDAGAGFNAALSQMGYLKLHIRTSNGTPSGGFYFVAFAEQFGYSNFIQEIRISENISTNTLGIYVYSNTFIGVGYYKVEGSGIEYIPVETATAPPATYYQVPLAFTVNSSTTINNTLDVYSNLYVAGTTTLNTAVGTYAATITNVQDSSEGLLVRATDNDSSLYLLNLQSSNTTTGQTWVNRFTVAKNGVATLSNLAGTGTRMVVADASGVLSTQAITLGTVTSVAALTLGTSGTDLSSTVANGTTTPVITLNVPTASAANRGALSATDWTTFNSKQNALTNPVTGTGTTNYLPKFTGSTTIGNSNIISDGSGKFSLGTAATHGNATFEQTTGEVGLVVNSSIAESPTIYLRDAGGAGYSTILANNNLYLNASRILVGTTSDNGAKLQVTGVGGVNIKSGNGDQLTLNNAGERFTQIVFSNNTVSKANIWWDNTNTELVLLANSSGTGHLRIASTGAATFSGTGNGIPLIIQDISAAITGQTAGYIGLSTSAFSGNNGDLVLYPRTSAASRILLMGGNVGIGTPSPVKTLDVRGTLAISNSASSYWYMDRDDSDGRFKIVDDANNDRFNITTSGNVLIGYTVDAGFKLDVNGTLRAGGVIVPSQGISYSSGIINVTGGSQSWINLGTISIAQGGDTAVITIEGGSGYNADNGQNASSRIFIRTSNGSPNGSGWFFSAYLTQMGYSSSMITDCIISQVNSTTYIVYVNFGTYSGNTYYKIEGSSYGWTASNSNYGATAPTGFTLPKIFNVISPSTFASSVTATNYIASAGNNSVIFSSSAATTGYQLMSLANSGAQLVMGINNSTGSFLTSSSAYASFISTGLGSTSLQLGTNNEIKLTITSAGNVLIGTTTDAGYKLDVAGSVQIIKTGTSSALEVGLSGVTGSLIRFKYNGGFVGSISTDGTNTAYNTSSDYRLKEQIRPIDNPLQKVLSLNPVNFKYKNSKTLQDGFIAHEIQEILPYLVTGEKDGAEMQEVDYSKLTPILIAAIKELKQEIDKLKNT